MWDPLACLSGHGVAQESFRFIKCLMSEESRYSGCDMAGGAKVVDFAVRPLAIRALQATRRYAHQN